ncbi:MAG: hypothetical protein IJY06_10295, partial [Oscillospiraceae bacterium]|nr:hypothetical protein [Oscillospiraceae bacterium]
GKPTAEFQSGEVAYLLRQGCTVDPDSSVEGDEVFYSGEIWGQTIGTETYPVLNGKKVIMCGTKYVNAHLDPCECTPIDAELSKDDGFVDTYTYGNPIDITAEDFTTLSDSEKLVLKWQDAQNNLLDSAPVNVGSYKLVVSIPQTYYDDVLYAEDTLKIDITIEKAALEASNFTFTAPENLTYDGSEKTAVLESTLDGIGEMTLTYYDENGEPLDDAPVNTGTYTVKADVAENENCQAASAITDENWTFTIGKADLTKADLIVIGSQYQVYDKNENLFIVVLSDSVIGAGELNVTYADANGEPVDSINGAGTYTVTAVISEGTNYNAASFDWTVTIYKSLLTGITVDVTAPEAAEVPQSIVEAGEGYTASIKWIPSDETFGYNAAYTAEVTLTPDANHQFTDKSKITAEGFTVTRNEDGTVTLTRTYDTTAKARITDLTAPEDVLLEEHQPDADAVIALLPKTIEIEAEDGTTELPITWKIEGEYALTANAEHTFIWTADCDDLDENGFDMTGQITVTNPNYTDISDQIVLTAEDITYGMEPDVSAVYDENDAEITYSMDGVVFDTLDAFQNENGVLPAGTYTVKAYYESETEMGSVTAEFTVNKANPVITLSGLEQVYTGAPADVRADVTLVNGEVFEGMVHFYYTPEGEDYEKYGLPTDVGTYTISASLDSTTDGSFEWESVNYNWATKEAVLVITKAVPDYTIPADLTATYGDTLADVALPEGFAWDDDTQSVGNAGTNIFTVTFTPADTDNYEVIKGIEVEVEVAKATPEVTPIIPEGEYIEGDELPEIGYESKISGIIEWLTELVDGLVEGENKLE